MASQETNRIKLDSPEAFAAAMTNLISSSKEMKKMLHTINESINAQCNTLLQGIQEIADSKEKEQ